MMNSDQSSIYGIALDQLPWDTVADGLRQKVIERHGTRLRVVEYGPHFVETHWCTRGHAGYVIEGEMQIDFDGSITTLRTDQAILIPAGQRHRHHATLKPTTLFLVEQVGSLLDTDQQA